MNGQVDPLADLRDIHLPADPSFWPPAPGWWLMALGLVLVLGLAIRYWQKRRLQTRPLNALLDELQLLELSGDDPHRSKVIAQMSSLIRRYAMTRFGRDRVARLQGKDWLLFLNQTGHCGDQFSNGLGSALADQPYRAVTTVDLASLRELIVKWARQCGTGR